MKIKRVREDIFRMCFFNDTILCPYDIDAVDMVEMVEQLSKAGREYVKHGLSLLSSEFKGLFDSAPAFKTTKEENRYYLELLKEKVSQLCVVDFSDVVELKNNQIYVECERLEKELKKPIYTTYMREYGEKLKAELQRKANFDTVKWVETNRNQTISMLQSVIEQTEPFYLIKNERIRKQEQRDRELIFCQIMQALSFFFDNDCPVYDGTETPAFSDIRAKYSVIDILSIRASLGVVYDRYNIDSVASYYECIEAFDKNIDEFSENGYMSYFMRTFD